MSSNLATPRLSRTSSRIKPKNPCIIIPPTPTSSNNVTFYRLPDTQPNTPFSPALIPPRRAVIPHQSPGDITPKNLEAATIASPDLLAIAELFATMKRTLMTLSTTFDSLGKQTEKIASLAPVIRATEQINDVRTELEEQIRRQEASLRAVEHLLETIIEESLIEHLKMQTFAVIRETIAKDIKDRVRRELFLQIPEDLCWQGQNHQREILEVQSNVHNFESRHYDANVRSTEPLRPLLRPLPTPEQSPTYVVRRVIPPVSAIDASPLSAFPRTPVPTPVVTSTHDFMVPRGINLLNLAPPTPSSLFPRDLKSLLTLGPNATRILLNDYRFENDTELSPITDEPRPKAAPREPSVGSCFSSSTAGSQENNIHKFKSRIGMSSIPSAQSMERPQLHLVIPGPKLVP